MPDMKFTSAVVYGYRALSARALAIAAACPCAIADADDAWLLACAVAVWAIVRSAKTGATSVAARRRFELKYLIAVVSWGRRREPDPLRVGLYRHILSYGVGRR